MEGASSDGLRALAPKWSLAGDDQLLNLLQNTHQKIISKCQDVNTKLEQMASALDDASINLQNLNNKFMALSNSQFIESRVYDDDDADITTDTQPVKDIPQPTSVDEISLVKASLAILDQFHETAEIMDDSDSDSDAEISVVLKPKDMYSHRPLPYIIGSQPWKNKWHAGLLVEDSDTDSSVSKRDGDIDQYSDSEEDTRPPVDDHTLSESSSSLPESARGEGREAPPPVPPPAPPARAADVAAALARKLAQGTHTIVKEEYEDLPPAAPVSRKVYKPEQPAASAIFSDEPPPLDVASDESSDEDIFAEINKHAPYTQRNKARSNLADDLFSFDNPETEEGDIFSDFAQTKVNNKTSKPKSSLFEGESEPELFAESVKKQTNNDIEKDETTSKKPVGGISLFVSNKGTETIGAAILKRNQRKSSTSGEESGSEDNINKKQIPEKPTPLPRKEETKPKVINKAVDEIDNKSIANREKDIFEDLFSKSEKKSVQATKCPVKVTNTKEKEKTNVKDLFSDNMFDDIDDIFTTDVKIPTKNSNEKSIFDDDDLFSDVGIIKSTNQVKESTTKDMNTNKSNVKDSKVTKGNKSILDSDDELFSDIKTDKPVQASESHSKYASQNKISSETSLNTATTSKIENVKPTETTKERNLFDDSPQIVKPDTKTQAKSKSIFDSDSDDDIFATIKTKDKETNKVENVIDSSKNINETGNKDIEGSDIKNKNSLSIDTSKAKATIVSPTLFEEDEIDDLFMAANQLKESKSDKNTNTFVENIIEKEPAFVNISNVRETHISNDDDVGKDKVFDDTINKKPKIVNKQYLEPTKPVPFAKKEIFGDSLVEDDLFSESKDDSKTKIKDKVVDTDHLIESSQEISGYDTDEEKQVESVTIPESQPDDIQNLVADTNLKVAENLEKEIEKELVIGDPIEPVVLKEDTTQTKVSVPNANIFDDVFSEPPAFEKPAESKKSKNVNALFDDDSDDESLFFKKDDVISDEKPEIFSKNANFGIFVDEPPAIDVDFTSKSTKNTDDDDLFNSAPKFENKQLTKTAIIDEKDLFSSIPKNDSKLVENVDDKDNESELFGAVTNKESLPKFIETDKLPLIVPKPKETVPASIIVTEDNTVHVPKTSTLPDSDKNTESVIGERSKIVDSDEELFAILPNLPKPSQKDLLKTDASNLNSNVEGHKANEFEDMFKSESPKKDDTKKIGKLNTKNFNINVNALIPGASPKKIPKEKKDEPNSEIEEPKMIKIIPDEPDFEHKPTSNKNLIGVTSSKLKEADVTDFKPKPLNNKDENDATDQHEHNPSKSIKFEDKSESGVLDNKASKHRPRIQVKRKPSTRKARHEAVRKSGIDFGDDTDNSSSFDEPKPISTKVDTKVNEETVSKNIAVKDNTSDKKGSSISKEEIIKSPLKNTDKEHKIEITKEQTVTEHEISSEKTDVFEDMLANLPPNKEAVPYPSKEVTETNQNVAQNKQTTTTKIVYILNDEDIFNTDTKTATNLFEPNSQNVDNNLFRSPEIQTLGKTYKESQNKNKELPKTKDLNINKEELTQKVTKDLKNQDLTPKEVKSNNKSLFDDSDEELFSGKKPVKAGKVTIFDSDSEDDLFTGKKSSEKKNKEVRNKEVKERRNVVKGSLFGDDDDDDDDLFGVSTKKKPVPKLTPSTSKESTATASKTAEPVFEDPLSMLGNDD